MSPKKLVISGSLLFLPAETNSTCMREGPYLATVGVFSLEAICKHGPVKRTV